MKVPHIKNRYADGNPGYKPRYRPGIGPNDLGKAIVNIFLYVGLVWFVIITVL